MKIAPRFNGKICLRHPELVGERYAHLRSKPCVGCQKDAHRAKVLKNPDKYIIEKMLKQNFGITLEDYNKMFERQKGCCAICKRHQVTFKNRLSVDHSHVTGKIRGLLCANCNHGIGLFHEDIVVLKESIKYLGEHND